MRQISSQFLPILIPLIVLAYALPWVVTRGSTGIDAALSPNAYDLAEWTSLAPAVAGENPVLLTPFLLRLPLLCIGLVAAFAFPRRWWAGVFALLVAMALLPPFEFVRDPGNLNYRQQLALAVVTLIGGGIGWSGVLGRFSGWIGALAALIGAVASLGGMLRGDDVMASFAIPVSTGLGGVVALILFGVVAILLALSSVQTQSRGTPTTRRAPLR